MISMRNFIKQERSMMIKRDLQKLMRSASGTPITRLSNKIRRLFLCSLKPETIKQKIQHRSGECVQCGMCCKLVFTCPFLGGTEENPRCMVYEGRPKPCVAFPIDERDLADVNFRCGYFFEKKTFPSPDLVQIKIPAYFYRARSGQELSSDI